MRILHLCLTVNSQPWLNIIVEERISYTGGSVNRLRKIGRFLESRQNRRIFRESGPLPLLYTWTPPNRNSFVLFTYSMPLKGAWVHVCTETCTHGIGKRAKMREFMSVGARLSTLVFRRYYQPYRMHRCRNIRNSAAQSKVSEVIQRARSVCFVTLLSTKTRHLVDTQ